MTETNLSGLILVDKQVDLTSTAVVRTIKNALKISRVGHLGTLDPFASGLLPIMVGSTTRLSNEFMDFDKQYLFTISLGVQTDTLDPLGTVIKQSPVTKFSKEHLLEVLNSFTGAIQQTPPAYSALKMNGRPLYEYMRTTGKLPFDIQTKTRTVNIKKCDLINLDNTLHNITLRVLCTKGTYVRSLARDIATSLGTVGMCSELRREKIGNWCVTNAISIQSKNLLSTNSVKATNQHTTHFFLENMISPIKLLPNIPHFILPQKFFQKLNTGNVLHLEKTEQDFDLFDQIEKYININISNNIINNVIQNDVANNHQKCFVSIDGSEQILFLANVALKDENKVAIKPHIKIK